MYDFLVSTMSAGGLIQLGAGTSADAVMTKFTSLIYQ